MTNDPKNSPDDDGTDWTKKRFEEEPPPGLMPDGKLNVIEDGDDDDDIWKDEPEDE